MNIKEKEENNGFADPGIWILIVILLMSLAYGIYDFYKKDGVQDRIDNIIEYVKQEFEKASNEATTNTLNQETLNINNQAILDQSSSNSNDNANSNNNLNIEPIPSESVNININNKYPLNYLDDFKQWYRVPLGGYINIGEYGIDVFYKDYDTATKKGVFDIKYFQRNTIAEAAGVKIPEFLDLTVKEEKSQNKDLNYYASILFRLHYYCNDTLDENSFNNGTEVILLDEKSYSNYTCTNRKNEQCQTSDTTDTYYYEYCDYTDVPFYQEYIKCGPEFAMAVQQLAANLALIGIIDVNDSTYCNSIN